MQTDRTLIVIPTYNERDNVGPLIERLLGVASQMDVLLLDDQSTDGTVVEAQRLFAGNPRFSAVTRSGSRSFGRSLLDGYRIALERGYARLIQMDADFSHEPQMVPTLISAAADVDVVIGSRYCEGGAVENWPWHRRWLSRFANEYVAWITRMPIHDSTSGFRCYTRHALETILKGGISAEGYAFQVEATFRAIHAGLRVMEVPITFTDRRAGLSKMSGKVIFESILKPWRLRFE